MKQLLVAIACAALLAGCATPETRIRNALIEAGLPKPVARCMAGRMVDRLEKLGLVERRDDPADRRRWQLFLTARAEDLMARMGECAQAVIDEFAGQQFGAFKPKLADLAVSKLAPISGEMSRLMQEPDEIDRILARGAERGRALAAPILQQTYDIVGMLR